MKVFLSWSGDLSHKVALTLRDWLPSVIQSIEPYVSSEDIDKGARWSTDIASELADSSYGILCVTKENLHAPWLTFEAGALSKTMDKSYVSPFLFGIKRAEINGPILQFQSTVFEKEDLKKLLLSLNKADDAEQLKPDRLEKALDVWYPDLEEKLDGLLKDQPQAKSSEEPEKQDSFSTEILEEILDLSRVNQKLLRSPDLDVHKELDSLSKMLQDIISRSEMEKDLRMRRKKKIHPHMIDELLHMSPRFRKNFTGFQIAISLFREDYPWIHDAGLDLVKTLRSKTSRENKRESVEAFQELIEFSFEHPMMRDMYRDDKHTYMMMRELPHMLRHALEQEL
ncbi:hypothetical protein CW748_10750 [Alteromonadales bacterium alter-6D02]|nr:hypothetical protein CW748_10750 [Alteromonadales bacterium alter-6D02]